MGSWIVAVVHGCSRGSCGSWVVAVVGRSETWLMEWQQSLSQQGFLPGSARLSRGLAHAPVLAL